MTFYHKWSFLCVMPSHCMCLCCGPAGHLLGFDKYMNMVLQNVEEVYTVLMKVQRFKLVMLTEGPAAGDLLLH